MLRRVNGEIVYVISSFSISFDDFGHTPKFSTQMDNQGFWFSIVLLHKWKWEIDCW